MKKSTAAIILLAILALVLPHHIPGVNAQIMGDRDKITPLTPTVLPHPDGQFVGRQDFAAYAWHPGMDAPTRPDYAVSPNGAPGYLWPIVAYYSGNAKPTIVWYWDGWFRSSNGAKWGKPSRWAYIRQAPEVWNNTTKQMDIPGLYGAGESPTPPTTPAKVGVHIDDIAGQQMIDILKRSFTTARLQDFMDLSPYDEPDTGAPEHPLDPATVSP